MNRAIYRGWIIAEALTHRYIGSHPDYSGPEDGRIVWGNSVFEVMSEIDQYLETNKEKE